MSTNPIVQSISQLFESWSGEAATLVLPLARTASNRQYFRIKGAQHQAIGCYGPDAKENRAFISFSQHFRSKGLSVPEIYKVDLDQNIYLQEDLGATTLYSFLLQKGKSFAPDLVDMYKKVLEQLAKIQIEGGEGLNYEDCYPRAAFDKQSMLWDLNTFKYYFLKLGGIAFDEQALEEDFHRFIDYLLTADCSYFMFRDFQSRNIMLKSGTPYFIDYQGGRKGALQYDLASLLFQPQAGIPFDVRTDLLNHYLDTVEQMIEVDRERFIQHYYGYVMIRRIQAFGTYGFRGLHERKAYFIKNIPLAIQDFRWVLDHTSLPIEVPELMGVLHRMVNDQQFAAFDKGDQNVDFLKVRINSFSYKKNGIPEDPSGNGGGFVFDCRCIHNPGRYEPYKKQTGRDEPVIKFLEEHSNMGDFLNNINHIIDEAVENYLERSFTSLMISFGCTGGQHRSVYAADTLARRLEQKYGLKVTTHHLEQERKNWEN